MIKKRVRGIHLGMIRQIRNQHATCGQTYYVFINSDALKPPSTYWTGRSVMPASSWWKQRPCWGWHQLPKVCKQSFQNIPRTCRVTLSLMHNYPQLSYLWSVFQQQSIFTTEQLSYRKSIWFLRNILKFAAFNPTLLVLSKLGLDKSDIDVSIHSPLVFPISSDSFSSPLEISKLSRIPHYHDPMPHVPSDAKFVLNKYLEISTWMNQNLRAYENSPGSAEWLVEWDKLMGLK